MTILFIDESKAKGYTMVATLVSAKDLKPLRREVRSLVLPRQRRIHFTKEGDSRKRQILSRLDQLGVQSYVFHCANQSDEISREACLTSMVAFAFKNSLKKIVIERDESIEQSDRRVLFREAKKYGLTDRLVYEHESPYAEPLLWIPDAIAWGYARGGAWGPRVKPLIAGVTHLLD